jgi:acyl carrier protein
LGLETIETVLWAEKEFGISIPNEEAFELSTVGDLSGYIHRKMVTQSGAETPSEDEVFSTLKNYLVAQYRMKPEWIIREAHLVSDLGMDS